MTISSVSGRSRLLWTLFAVSAVIGIAAFFIPAFIIRPFTHQSARGMLLAMAVRQQSPLISLLCAVVCLISAALIWQTSRWWARSGLAVIMAIVAASAVMSRLNYFEWMFHPIDSPKFEDESASKLDKSEMILAVTFGSNARAYPILRMAYHHIFNDVVGDVPIAVTY